MASLHAILSPDSATRVRDCLLTLLRFNDEVYIEARPDGLAFSTLEVTNTAFITFDFTSKPYQLARFGSPEPSDAEGFTVPPTDEQPTEGHFYDEYIYSPDPSASLNGTRSSPDDDFPDPSDYCGSFLSRVLLWAFNAKPNAATGEHVAESITTSYTLSLLDDPRSGSHRFVIGMPCAHGVTKTFKLIYEPLSPIRPVFSREDSPNQFSIGAKALLDHVDHFVQKGEHLDIRYFANDDKIDLKCYTQKVVNAKEIIKKPSKTHLLLARAQFKSLSISLFDRPIRLPIKDFVAMTQHSGQYNTTVNAYWSKPKEPILFSYEWEGMRCDFTIMTTVPIFDPDEEGEQQTVRPMVHSSVAGPGIKLNHAPPKRNVSAAMELAGQKDLLRGAKTKRGGARLLPVRGKTAKGGRGDEDADGDRIATQDSGLFLPDLDDTRQQAERDVYDIDDEPIERVGWDPSMKSTMREARDGRGSDDEATKQPVTRKRRRLIESDEEANLLDDIDEFDDFDTPPPTGAVIQPTQRLSQIRGMFDDFPDF